MLESWIATTKRVIAHDKLSDTDYEFESVFPDGEPDGTAFCAAEMNKIIDAINALPNNNLVLDSHIRLWDGGMSFSGAYTSGGYTATLWWVKNLSGGNITISPPDGGGMTIQAAGTVQVSQPIEGAELLDGKTVTLSWSVDGTEHAKTYVFNAASSNAATVEITGGGTLNWVKLEVGENVTPCIPRPIAIEKCARLRYYQTIDCPLTAHARNPAGDCFYSYTPVEMQRAPDASGSFRIYMSDGNSVVVDNIGIGAAVSSSTITNITFTYRTAFGTYLAPIAPIILDARTVPAI